MCIRDSGIDVRLRVAAVGPLVVVRPLFGAGDLLRRLVAGLEVVVVLPEDADVEAVLSVPIAAVGVGVEVRQVILLDAQRCGALADAIALAQLLLRPLPAEGLQDLLARVLVPGHGQHARPLGGVQGG
eukprot:15460276-Alexandrium_andersonii.AAC.1